MKTFWNLLHLQSLSGAPCWSCWILRFLMTSRKTSSWLMMMMTSSAPPSYCWTCTCPHSSWRGSCWEDWSCVGCTHLHSWWTLTLDYWGQFSQFLDWNLAQSLWYHCPEARSLSEVFGGQSRQYWFLRWTAACHCWYSGTDSCGGCWTNLSCSWTNWRRQNSQIHCSLLVLLGITIINNIMFQYFVDKYLENI